jgi:hypothetical protein
MVEELHLRFFAEPGLSAKEARATDRALGSRRFRQRVVQAVRDVVRGNIALKKVTVRVTQ